MYWDDAKYFFNIASRIKRSMGKKFSEVLKPYGLSGFHAMFFNALNNNPKGLSQAELTENLGIDKAHVSRVVASLEEKGFAKRESREGESRPLVVLTEKGVETAQMCDEIFVNIKKTICEAIPKENRDEFIKTMETLADIFEKN